MSEYTYEARTTRVTVNKKGDPIFSPLATHIEIADEAAGEFLIVRQDRDDDGQYITIDAGEEWEAIKGEIDEMFAVIKLAKEAQ